MIRIGVLFSWSADVYTKAVVGGIRDRGVARGAAVIGLWCGPLPAVQPFWEIHGGLALSLVSPQLLDGLLVVSGSTVSSPDAVVALAERFAPMPVVSIAVETPGVTSILVDNEPGLRSVLEHLVDVHDRKRIAFAGDPKGNLEAVIRHRVYREVLESRGLAYDPTLVAGAGLDSYSGMSGMRRILDDGGRPDAVYAVNDVVAEGVLEVLEERGLRVPEDVALVGYDDSLSAMGMIPPLTTVHQPVTLLGVRAVDALLDLLAGQRVDPRIVVPTFSVIRQSCGCDPISALTDPDRALNMPTNRTKSGRPIALEQDRYGPTEDRLQELLRALLLDANDGDQGRFRTLLVHVLSDLVRQGRDLLPWQSGMARLRQLALGARGDAEAARRVASLLFEGHLLLTDSVHRASIRALTRTELKVEAMSTTTGDLSGQPDIASMIGRVRDNLPRLGFAACHIALLEPSGDHARLRFSSILGREEPIGPEGIRYETKNVLPAGIPFADHPGYFLIEPLSQERAIGLLCFEGAPEDALLYISLANQLTTSIVRLEREQELARAYRLLQENHDKLVIAEKMASLGRLTAGIAHEMNTPLGAIRAALVELKGLVAEYRESAGVPAVTPEDHVEIAGEMGKVIELAENAATRAAGFVRSIKLGTRDLGSRDDQTFDAVRVARDTLLLLEHEASRSGSTIAFSPASATIEIKGPPPRFSQVLTNLVTNAIDASRPKGGGTIDVVLEATAEGLRLSVRDHGTGIGAENLPKIFDPMFTTKPFGEGTGLGLSLVHDIVTVDFGGSVDVESTPGEGTMFTVELRASRRSLRPGGAVP
jgi:signal transduction histidine kinase/ABC-type sugar transport system substrate-binding protein